MYCFHISWHDTWKKKNGVYKKHFDLNKLVFDTHNICRMRVCRWGGQCPPDFRFWFEVKVSRSYRKYIIVHYLLHRIIDQNIYDICSHFSHRHTSPKWNGAQIDECVLRLRMWDICRRPSQTFLLAWRFFFFCCCCFLSSR